MARCYATTSAAEESVSVLEDLDAAGFELRKSELDMDGGKRCLRWLANLHARFMGMKPEGLWQTGSYWHFETRPDELAAMAEGDLKNYAVAIDQRLTNCNYQTLVHGDAKVDNFCFSSDGLAVAAVDFQYVGGGCCMKDVAYFISSCLNETDCERYEIMLLDYYFSELGEALKLSQCSIDIAAVEQEWRPRDCS